MINKTPTDDNDKSALERKKSFTQSGLSHKQILELNQKISDLYTKLVEAENQLKQLNVDGKIKNATTAIEANIDEKLQIVEKKFELYPFKIQLEAQIKETKDEISTIKKEIQNIFEQYKTTHESNSHNNLDARIDLTEKKLETGILQQKMNYMIR